MMRSRTLDRELARRAVLGVVVGASRLLADTADLAALVQTFIGYRGTTEAALRAMLDGGFRELVHSGVQAAGAKAAQMAEG
jgi:pyrroline-5-carboxylate reductase